MPVQTWPCAGLQMDTRGIVVDCNTALGHLAGLPLTAIVGHPFDALLTGASRVLYQSYLQPLLRMHGNVEEISLTVKVQGGPPVDVLLYSARRSLADGSAGVQIMLAPIRRRRGIEDEMLRIKRAADHAPGLIFQLMQLPDGSCHFPFVSQAVRRLYEITADDARASAQALFGRIEGGDGAALLQAMREAADRGEDWAGSYRVHLPGGRLHWHEMECTPRDLADGVRVWHGHIADITTRRELEATLAEQAASERMNAVRSVFLARVSHELRTPLNGIIGFAQLMAADAAHPLAPTQAERVSVITASGQHLLQLVNQVLDVSSLETGQTRITMQALPLPEALSDALTLVQAQAAASGVQLQLQAVPAGLQVLADSLRLRQVLVNLLSNAIKYNHAGGQVTVRAEACSTQRAEGSEAQVRVSISDSGAGLGARQIAQLFQPFNRLGAEARVPEGSGLGLVITRHLLTLMGGSIEVQSSPDAGSTFSFVLRAAGVCATPPSAGEPGAVPARLDRSDGGARGRVLCVEDNPVNALLLEALIGMRPGVTLRLASDGATAMAALADFEPDLLLLDMHLPDMTGTALLQALRARQPPCQAQAVMVSAAARADDIARALSAGFESYWTKPLDIERVLAELDRLLPGSTAAG